MLCVLPESLNFTVRPRIIIDSKADNKFAFTPSVVPVYSSYLKSESVSVAMLDSCLLE